MTDSMHNLKKLIFVLIPFISFAKDGDSLTMVCRGIIIPSGKTYADAQVVWFELPRKQIVDLNKSDFVSRQETYQTDFYALHKLSVKQESNEMVIEEAKAYKKKLNRGAAFCRNIYRISYNDKTGYFEGNYKSIDCRNVSGRVVVYETDTPMSFDNEMSITHAWVRKLIDDLKNNKVSPSKIAEMRRDFEFKPLYFDYDKDIIKEEYKNYLIKMTEIVLSHSDLRIKVTGHTDGDGSDAYNIELSKRRAKAIVNFFIERGLSEDRIEIDFKGKREPVAPNNTEEGKQKNRRVDFEFI